MPTTIGFQPSACPLSFEPESFLWKDNRFSAAAYRIILPEAAACKKPYACPLPFGGTACSYLIFKVQSVRFLTALRNAPAA
jgi:hypothetical protein